MVVIMRRDLRNTDSNKLPKGKLIAQGGHGYLGAFLNLMDVDDLGDEVIYHRAFKKDSFEYIWLSGDFIKICLGVDSEQELMDLYYKAKDLEINTVLIKDKGHTQFDKPTNTCIGIGPDLSEKIDLLTGHLKSY